MLFNLFRSGQITIFLLLFLLYAGCRISGFFSLELDAEDFNNSVLTMLPVKLFMKDWIGVSLAGLVVLVAGWRYNQSVNNHELLDNKGFLPLFFALLLLSSEATWYGFSNLSVVVLLLPFALEKVFRLAYPDTDHRAVFDLGFIIGCTAVIYFPTAILLIWIYQALLILRNFNLREWTMPLIGFGLPFLYLWAYYYLTDTAGNHFQLKNYFQVGFPDITGYSWYYLTFLAVVGLTILMALPTYLRAIQLNKIRIRKSLSMTTWLIFYGIVGVLLFKADEAYFLMIMLFPLTMILSVYFEKQRTSRWAKYLSWLVVISFLVNILSGYF